MRKGVKIVLVVVSVLLVVGLVAGLVVGNLLFNLALLPQTDKSAVFGGQNEGDAPAYTLPDAALQELERRRSEQAQWDAAVEKQDVYIESNDALRLRAVKVENDETRTNRWAILCHGYMSNSEEMMYPAVQFYGMGFNVLMPDARGHGQSEGGYIGMGWDDRLDVVGWINYLISLHPDAEIVLYGVSMGGATVMMVSGEALPQNVKAIVEDCGYSSIWDEFSYQLKQIFGLPAFPVLHFASLVTRVRAGYWLGSGSAVNQVAKATTPMLFIHGTEDDFVPYAMLDVVYEAANVPKEKYEVEGAGHGMASLLAGDAYWQKVEDFISPYLTAA